MWHPHDVVRRARRGREDPAIDRDTAERLLDGAPGPVRGHGRLSALLAAVAGPARPDEIAGERAAVAAFTREYRSGPQPGAVAPRPRTRAGTVVAVSVSALLLGSTAYAAGTGHLPDTLQGFLPGAPAPVPDRPTRAGPTDRESGRAAPTLQPSTDPVPPPSAAGPAGATDLDRLCRAWAAFRADPRAGPVTAEERRALTLAAGGANAINGFCQRRLDPSPQPSATTGRPGNPAPGAGKPSHPAKPSPH